jgi:FAD/FMN-containing dehydrogenase
MHDVADTARRAGWNVLTRQWTNALGGAAVDRVPDLDGALIVDGDELVQASRDLGNLVHARPGAVLRPASAADIARMIAFCSQHEIAVAARGEAHTTHGQGLVDGGLIIDMTALRTVHSVTPDGADVDAGVLWSDLVIAAARHNLRVSTLTGYLKLTVGGTLSVGGISPAWREGAQIDQVQALQVVTGRGDVEWCSPSTKPDLFYGALGGLGQVAIITRAVLGLTRMPQLVRTWRLPYVDVEDSFAAMRQLMAHDQVDELYCMVLAPERGTPPVYLVHASKYFDAGPAADDAHVLRDLPAGASATGGETTDSDYLSHAFAIDEVIDEMRSGDWDRRAKPWFDIFLPDTAVQEYIADVVPKLTAQDWSLPHGGGFVLLFPHLRRKFTCPRLRLPEDELVWLFDILDVGPAPGRDHTYGSRMVRRNHRLWDRARAVGGVRYPIGALTFGPEEWRAHYGHIFNEVVSTRHRYDPASILTPGPGIVAAHER